MIIAKPVIDNQYWILKKDDAKIGNIQVAPDGSYDVKILDRCANFKTIPMLRNSVDIEFQGQESLSAPEPNQVHGYHTGCTTFNGMWNVQLKLPLFTKEEKSKSWFAAGWYRIKQHRTWKAVQNPKLITLERYKFQGPFYSKEEANESVS
jgi:hypothetical protein